MKMKPPTSNEIRKPTKSISGVTPIAVVLPPKKCKHGTCLYCPTLGVPQSYTPKSPAIMRAMLLNYDAYKQVQSRLNAFKIMRHQTDKIELIIMGGTFLQYSKKFQYNFIKSCYDALNNKKSSSLEKAKKFNEKAKHRCVALCIETRPDACSESDIKRMLDFGATRVELGVQAIDDKIYRKVKRGHTVKNVIKATQLLKDSGFKVSFHLMPSLPGSSFDKDIKMFKEIFKNNNFKPDQIKIYPCQVIKGSELEKLHYKGKYNPYTTEQLRNLIIEMLKIVPEYCRVMRIMREIHPDYLIAGTTRIDLRKEIEQKLRKQNIKLKEIRFREVGFNIGKERIIDNNAIIKVIIYIASNGKEIFLQAINRDNILFGLLRLRIPYKPFLQILKNSAIVRELHVYGRALEIGKIADKKEKYQHIGLGKLLMQKAEEIVKSYNKKLEKTKKYQNKIEKIAVISGVGVREYYKKLGYKLKDGFMVKEV